MISNQLTLPFSRTWGGRREHAGHPVTRRGVAHRLRADFAARYPIHVTLHVAHDCPPLRSTAVIAVIHAAIAAAHRPDFGIVHFTVMADHIHLIIEAAGRAALTSGMQGFKVRMARSINSVVGRSGQLFDDRYHERILKTPREVRHALRYVLNNHRHHAAERGHTVHATWFDPYSSAAWFDGWKEPLRLDAAWKRSLVQKPAPTRPPKVWLLTVGWRIHGLIAIDEVPGPKRTKSS